MDYLERMNLQLFAGDDDDEGDYDYDLDDFDLDLGDDDADDDDDNFGFDSNTGMVTKERASKLVQKRLAKERAKFESELASKTQTYEQFKKLYGVSPEEAINFGIQQMGQQPTPPAPQQQLDPYTAKLVEIDNWRKEEDSRRQQEREALEFVREFPGVADKDIPPEVLARRAKGGLTLAEAYKAHMFAEHAKTAAQTASQTAARNINSRKAMRTEGTDYTGSQKATIDMLDPEERRLAADFDMTPKELLAYRRKAEKYKEKL